MPATIEHPNEIFLNNRKYRTKGPVRSALSSIYPRKQVIGDYTRDSQERASVLAMSDWRGGIGLNKMRNPNQANRTWWSTCQLRYNGHLVLPPLATTTAASGVSGNFTVGALGELGGAIYGAFGTKLHKYDNTVDSWGSSLHTLPAVATDVITFRMAGTVYLAFATSGGYTYTSDGAAFVDDTKDTQFFTFWDDRLWGIDSTGQLWFSTAIGVETDDAQLQLPNNSVTNLFVGRVPGGERAIYVSTIYGPQVHDAPNARFIETELEVAPHPDNGKGSSRFRDALFFSAGNGVFRYGPAGGSSTGLSITLVGPDRDDGLPSDKRGAIRQLVSSTNELLAIFDATTSPSSVDMYVPGNSMALGGADVIPPDSGFSHILGWDGNGWEVKWLGAANTQMISYALVSYAYSKYRLWWAHNQRVYWMELPRDIINPNEISTFPYAASGTHETPWFDADQTEVDKLALELRIDCRNMTSTETAAISYGTNYAASWTSLGTITTDGITTYLFPNSVTPTGTEFRAIRLKIDLARGSTTTLSPDVLSATLTYRKKLPAKYVHVVEVDLTGDYNGRSPKEQRAALTTAIETKTKVEFTFRDDSGLTRNYYVDVVQGEGLEETGLSERGTARLTLVEP